MAGRGRPRIIRATGSSDGNAGGISGSEGDGDSGSPAFDPGEFDALRDSSGGDTASGSDNNGTPRKRRAYTRRDAKTPKAVDLSSLAGLLIGFHALAAIKIPEMELSDAEAKQLQERLEAVARWHSIAATQKAIDYAGLLGVVGYVYGTRIAAISVRKKRERGNIPVRQVRPNQPSAGTNAAAPPSQTNIVLPSQFGSSVTDDGIVH